MGESAFYHLLFPFVALKCDLAFLSPFVAKNVIFSSVSSVHYLNHSNLVLND